jgi:hypothetical protein
LVPSKHEEIGEKTKFYGRVMELVRQVVEVDELIKQCVFDIRKGARPPDTAGIARWGSAFNAAEYLDLNCVLLGNPKLVGCRSCRNLHLAQYDVNFN